MKPIPIAIWPPETRINETLGVGEGLKGVLKMRWARFSDVKKRGAKRESQFYRKHGEGAGKELFNGRDLPPANRSRIETGPEQIVEDQEKLRKRLDAELDNFLREPYEEEETIPGVEEDDHTPGSPPSKMRSDYIASDGRTLLDQLSEPTLFESNPADKLGLKDRLTIPLPRRARGRGGSHRRYVDAEGDQEPNLSSLWDRLSTVDVDSDGSRRRGSRRNDHGRDTNDSRDGRRRGKGNERPRKTQQELDDELDAFLKQE
jgi:hypothetical protein